MNLPQGSGLIFILTGLVAFLCFKVLEGGFSPNKDGVHTNITPQSILLAIVSVGAAVWLLGPITGIVLVIGIAIHEFGHVAAFRSIGHDDARFRLIPLLGGVAISNKLPKDQLSEFYIAIMGPGIMLVPLVISGVYLETFFGSGPLLDIFAQAVFVITGAINFFNLLPFWPLDGGRIVRAVTMGYSPAFSQMLTLGMSVGLILWALYAKQPFILLVALIGFSAARRSAGLSKLQPPMTGSQAFAAIAAYLLTTFCFWSAGSPLIKQILLR